MRVTAVVVKGAKSVDMTLKRLDKAADRITRSVIGAGLSVQVRAMKKAAPVKRGVAQGRDDGGRFTKSEAVGGTLKQAIGKRLEKKKSAGGRIVGKAGINVGKKKAEFAPHSHLVALGTKPRARKSIGGKFAYITNPTEKQLSTGTMPANPFIRVAAASSSAAVMSRMRKVAEKRLTAEAKKL